MIRSFKQKILDSITFPIRALILFEEDRFGLSSLASERYDYVESQVKGYCLDVGCGRNNRFIKHYCKGNGIGIDVYKYEGLTDDNILDDPTVFPFNNNKFDSITFIASINHIPQSIRDTELTEAYRTCKHGGNIIVTMGVPIAEIIVHKLVYFYDMIFKTSFDMDGERGMGEEEAYYLTKKEIISGLKKAGFVLIERKPFLTQWGLNSMFIGYKK